MVAPCSRLRSTTRSGFTFPSIFLRLDEFVQQVFEITHRAKFVETGQFFLLKRFDFGGALVDGISHYAVCIEKVEMVLIVIEGVLIVLL